MFLSTYAKIKITRAKLRIPYAYVIALQSAYLVCNKQGKLLKMI